MNASILNHLADLKRDTLTEARRHSIPILVDQEQIGTLVPIGPWILSDEHHIGLICAWRQASMRMFLAQFESTMERTRHYLEARSVGEADRILFLIHDQHERCVGHGGFSGISALTAELDNLMRGVSGGHPGLIYHAERTLMSWLFDTIGSAEITARILSYNWMVMELHQSLGFTQRASFPLKKMDSGGIVNHETTDTEHANVRYTCLELALTPDAFRAALSAQAQLT